jgi:hypothetical protein
MTSKTTQETYLPQLSAMSWPTQTREYPTIGQAAAASGG